MSNIRTNIIRNRLRATVSAFAITAGALVAASGANAQTVTLDSTSGTYTLTSSTATTVELVSGTNAYYVKSNVTWAPPANSLKLAVGDSNGNGAGISTTGSCIFSWDCGNATAPTVVVDSGATLTFAGRTTVDQSWYFGNVELQSALIANGDVVFEFPGPTQSWGTPLVALLGSNQFNGNVTLLDNAYVQMGYSWAAGANTFGPNTNLILGSGAQLELYQNASVPLVLGGNMTGTGLVTLFGGTLVINGQNTVANPFHGTLIAKPGTTLIIGDASHAGAVIGDPGNVAGYTLTLPGTVSGGTTLRGFGTVAGNLVNTNSLVQPGSATALGTLTVQGNYTQNAVGTLKVQVSPTGASALHVVGNAALNGTLGIVIGPGSYKTQIYNVVQVDGTMSGDFSSVTTDSSVQGAIAAVTKTAHGYSVVTQVVQGAASTAPIAVGHLGDVNRLNNYYLVGSLYDRIAQDTPRSATEIGRNKYAWIEGFGQISSVARNDVGYHTDTEGVRAGLEYRTESNATLGLAFSYSTGSLKAKGDSTAAIDTWHVAAYGGYDVQYARLDGVVFYDASSTTVKRDFGTDGVAKASPDLYSYGASIQASRSMLHGLLTPYVRGIYSRQHVDASVESGAPLLNLGYQAINANTFVGDLGVRINPLRADSKTKLLVTLAVEHDFSPLGERVDGTFPISSTQSWFSYWRGDSENTALVGIDIARQLTDRLEISGRVNGRKSLYQTSGEVAFNARYRF